MRLLRELISQRLGIQVRNQDVDKLQRTLAERCELLQLSDLAQYASLLQSANAQSESEWEQLATLLTTGETFFFRGKSHTDALRNHILPALIESRQEERALRIWSAGCSSGEEPYSLAMMLDELLGELLGGRDWSISLLATDIDVEALNKARRGIYADWSFRQVDPKIREKYFRSVGKDWELEQRIKDLVTFEPLNLLTDVFPSRHAREMDLIVCRNVFIYFSAEHVGSIVTKFAATLRSGGFLLAGHGELQGQDTDPLVKRMFSDSVVLQRGDAQNQPTPRAADLVRNNVNSSGPPLAPSARKTTAIERAPSTGAMAGDDAIEQIAELFSRGRHALGFEQAARVATEHPGDARICCLMAQAHADLGNHPQALDWCQRAIAIDAFAVVPQYLLANIAEAEGRYDDAKALLRKVIYLDPSHVAAQLDLAGLYEREGDTQLADKTRIALVELLKSKPDSFPIDAHESLTVGELVRQLNQTVRHG